MAKKDTQKEDVKLISEKKSWYEIIESYAEKHHFSFDLVLEIFRNETQKVFERDIDPDAQIIWEPNHEEKTITIFNVAGSVEEEGFEIEFDDNNDWNFDQQRLISMNYEDAKKINPNVKYGDNISIEFNFSALTQRQKTAINNGFKSELKAKEKERIREVFDDKIGKEFDGKIKHALPKGGFLVEILDDENNVYTSHLNKNKATRIKELHPGSYVNVILEKVNYDSTLNVLEVSMIKPNQVENILKETIAEIANGDIIIKKVQRIPGIRTKVAVEANPDKNFDFDIIGSIFGEGAKRIIAASNLLGEKIDIIRYSDNRKDYIINALSPARIIDIAIHKKTGQCFAVVDEDNITIAIGKRGINNDLASKLTENKINIVTVDEAIRRKIPFNQSGYKPAREYDKPLFSHSENKMAHKKSKSNNYFKDIDLKFEEFDKDVSEFLRSTRSNEEKTFANENESIKNSSNTRTPKRTEKTDKSFNFDDVFSELESKLNDGVEFEETNDSYDFVNELGQYYDQDMSDPYANEEDVEFDETNSNESANKETSKNKKKVIEEYKKIKDFTVDTDLVSYGGINLDLDLSEIDDEWDEE
ncbi:NusA N-terminal domain-containing protein [Mycoplasma sp. OR1901]|uniref:NusA N-terminal domain-containing protein n=1 Tax=Mycoplasma sp. OR1901 TaxID=2742195 RepID=UPI001581772A|nr:NusA N-terminal domain-containing protein [Mycoplasma sp. OR1901]QKT05539.1 hypothetical protein HTZ87_02385 [Mycoplasma sp. OR1901]